MAFFLTRSVVCPKSLTTCSVMADAIVELSICPSEVRQITISCTSPFVKSLIIVATSMIRRSLLLSKKREHIRYPILFKMRFLFWVRLIAWMWAKGADYPSISIYSARIRCSLICFGVRFFSASLGLSAASSARIIRSYYCFDLVSPMLLMSSLRSFERCEEAVVINYSYSNIYLSCY